MEGVFKTLDGVEALVTKMLVWVIHIPKTLLWIIFYPNKIRKYIHEELNPEIKEEAQSDDKKNGEKPQPFDGFIPPVILLLVVALIPALLLGFRKTPYANITMPTEEKSMVDGNPQASEPVPQNTFEVEAKFTSSADNMRYKVTWWVEEKTGNSQKKSGSLKQLLSTIFNPRGFIEEKINDGQYKQIGEQVEHSELNGTDGTIRKEGNNIVKDTFHYKFPRPGRYYINVTVQKLLPRGKNINNPLIVETYTHYVYVDVPAANNPELKGSIVEISTIKTSVNKNENRRLDLESFSGLLKKESTIFLAICMLFPPLFFAFIADLVTQKKVNDRSLREAFYAECYYFSPLSLAIWAFYFSLIFFTGDVFPERVGNLVIYIPLVSALIWFIVVETNALANVSEDDKITPPAAFLIVIFNLTILASLGLLLFIARNDARMQDTLRVYLIRFYVVAGLALLLAYFVHRRMNVNLATYFEKLRLGSSPAMLRLNFVSRWKSKQQQQKQEQQSDLPAKPKESTSKRFFRKAIVFLSIITVIFCCIPTVLIMLVPADGSNAALTPTGTPTGVIPGSTPLPAVQVQTKHYMDDFTGPLTDWEDPLVTSGDESQIKIAPVAGKLHFQLLSQEDQAPQAYLINKVSTYTDVQVETVVKNNDSSHNTVSLICRFNDYGWYEIEVSNSGYYYIYAYDRIEDSYIPLTSGETPVIKKDKSENKYTAICQGKEIMLLVNDNPVARIEDTTFNFSDGKFGIALFSPDGQAVDVEFDSVSASLPSSRPDFSNLAGTPVPIANMELADPLLPAGSEFTEEFDGSIDQWEVLGDPGQVKLPPENGSLRFQLSIKQGQTPSAYLINTANIYTDVQVEAVTMNNGNNSNGVDLICRLNDNGWYEFEFSSSGEYTIYAFDAANESYIILTSGSSTAIETGLAQNTYGAKCVGNELTLLINGISVESIRDTTFNFTEGLIGIGVSSRKGFPVDVSYETVTVSVPSPVEQRAETTPTATPAAEATPGNPTPIPAGQPNIEEFDGSLDSWEVFGDASQVKLPPENGILKFKLTTKEGQTPPAFLIDNATMYTDVQVDAVIKNNGNNSNGVSLICRFNENGWYEFVVSSSGIYSIYAYDAINNAYNELASGSSSVIKPGLAENRYTAVCKGNELALTVNDAPVQLIQDTTFDFTEGKIGIGVSSLQGLPVEVDFESIAVSIP